MFLFNTFILDILDRISKIIPRLSKTLLQYHIYTLLQYHIYILLQYHIYTLLQYHIYILLQYHIYMWSDHSHSLHLLSSDLALNYY